MSTRIHLAPSRFPTLKCAMRVNARLAAVLSLLAVASVAGRARADVLANCDSIDALITCAAADVGKPCRGGGSCYAIGCASGAMMTFTTVYRCDTCPPVIDTDGGAACSIPTLGMACGDGGTCGVRPSYCPQTSGKYVCQGPAGPAPSGPPADDAGASDAKGGAGGAGTSGGAGAPATSSGCDVAPKPSPGPGLIGLGLVAVGLVFFFIDRLRRRPR
jgi:hypothetical protein